MSAEPAKDSSTPNRSFVGGPDPERNLPRQPRLISLIASLMVLFGLAEVVTGFRHAFFGLATAESTASTAIGVAIGALYIAAGCAIIPMRRLGAAIAIGLLAFDIAGRIWMGTTGLYPMNSARQVLSLVAGTSIVAGFATIIVLQWKKFR